MLSETKSEDLCCSCWGLEIRPIENGDWTWLQASFARPLSAAILRQALCALESLYRKKEEPKHLSRAPILPLSPLASIRGNKVFL